MYESYASSPGWFVRHCFAKEINRVVSAVWIGVVCL